MAVVTFWSDYLKETGQTYLASSIATTIAANHNQKILLLSTDYDDDSLQSCFWNSKKQTKQFNNFGVDKKIDIDSGLEGIVKAMSANRVAPEQISNYTKIVFENRLEVLPGFIGRNREEYIKVIKFYPEIIATANKYYDLVIVDVNKGLGGLSKAILRSSDLIVASLNQRQKTIDHYMELVRRKEVSQKDNVIPVLGKYDNASKYNAKNVSRYMKLKKEINTLSYNTLFFESCEEGKIVDFLMKIRTVSGSNPATIVGKELNKLAEDMLQKLKELQMRI